MPNDFRLSAKRVFLTYPQCGELSKERLEVFIRDDRHALWYCIGLEQHEDGGNHLHAYVEFADKLNVRDAKYFDVDGKHPNIQPVRKPAAVLRYVQKGGDFIGNCEALSKTRIAYGEIINSCSNAGEFLAGVVENHPRDAALHYGQLRTFADNWFPQARPRYVPKHTQFNIPSGVLDWVIQDLEGTSGILLLLLRPPTPEGGRKLRGPPLPPGGPLTSASI